MCWARDRERRTAVNSPTLKANRLVDAQGQGSSWDVFICHASEDKESVARPLSLLLRMAGLAVWFDEFELRIGDSLLERIDRGLAGSHFGAVIISPAFMEKRWSQQELRGMFALEQNAPGMILPVWHQVSVTDVTAYSPILADRVAASTDDGIDAVGRAILKVVLSDAELRTKIDSRRIRQLSNFVDEDNRIAIADFLVSNQVLLAGLYGVDRKSLKVLRDPFPEIKVPHICFATPIQSTGLDDWKVLEFLSTRIPIVDPNGEAVAAVTTALHEIRLLRKLVAGGYPSRSDELGGLNSKFPVTIFAGRRSALTETSRLSLNSLNEELIGAQVRTHDTLLDRALELFGLD
jgi:hypothetical protein